MTHPNKRELDAVSIMALQFSRESYMLFPFSTVMLDSLGHEWMAFCSIFVTELGIVIDASRLQ